MASNNLSANAAEKKGIKAQASGVARKRCGRCRTAVEENEFCRTCREFFRMLRGQEEAFTTGARRTQRGV